MAKQLHKRFSTGEVKMLLRKYLDEKVELACILEILKIKRSRFFELLKEYRKDPDEKEGVAEIRIWYKDILTDVYHVKNSDLNLVHF